MFFGAAEIYEY